ncbi:MAG: N-acetylmuramoyl-L-alanine amidase [Anaerolineales bacterium]
MSAPRSSRTSSESTASAFARETARHVGVVLLVALIVATVYSLWTPASIIPGGAARGIALALATEVGPATTAVPPTATSEPRPVVGIVSGHLGNDAGAVCPDGLTEADINLEVANRVQANLEQAGFQVDLLNEFDARLSGYRARALVSVHADSCDYINDVATGYKVTGSLESRVPEESTRLAACLIDRYGERTQMDYHAGSITFDMTYYHAYREIAPETPAAIIEVGFLNLDREMLVNHPDQVAQGITDGILCYVYQEPVGGGADN